MHLSTQKATSIRNNLRLNFFLQQHDIEFVTNIINSYVFLDSLFTGISRSKFSTKALEDKNE